MKKLVFSGCSFTSGLGWLESDPAASNDTCSDLWTNLVSQSTPRFSNLSSINIGKGGASNTEIFEETVQAISSYPTDIDTIFCQWTSMPRYNFRVGFELWDTSESLAARTHRKHDIKLNRGDQWSREYINDLLNRLRVLHHLHWEIVKVVRYSNIIKKLCQNLGINVFFINGLCPWDENYFIKLIGCEPKDYTEFTKTDILNIDTRDDEDIYKLYTQAHQDYAQAGGIDERDWINLYDSFLKNKIDVNFDKSHPGKLSNQRYQSIIINKLEQINFL